MARRTLLRCVLFLLTGLPLLTLASAQTPDVTGPPIPRRLDQGKRSITIREQLQLPVEFRGFEDPDTKLDVALAFLERAYGIPFDINAQAFKEEMCDDVLARPLGKTIPKMKNVALSTVLRKVLERIPSESGTMWVVTGGVVEITTQRAYHAEFYPCRPNGPFPALVFTNFEKVPLEDALKKLAEDADANIVLDAGHAGVKAKEPVTARLTSVPLDTVLLMLADMADLEPVEMDGVYYVTTKENAETLRKKLGKPRTAKAEGPMKAEPAPQKTP